MPALHVTLAHKNVQSCQPCVNHSCAKVCVLIYTPTACFTAKKKQHHQVTGLRVFQFNRAGTAAQAVHEGRLKLM